MTADDWTAFADTVRSLHLATCDDHGRPHASLAPFVRIGRDAYILVSELAGHTAHLTASGRASILLAGGENAAPQPFARERLSFDCSAEPVGRDDPRWQQAVAAMRQRFGDIVETLVALPDFRLIRLHPLRGVWVRGFGNAWRIEGEGLDELHHIGPPRAVAPDTPRNRR